MKPVSHEGTGTGRQKSGPVPSSAFRVFLAYIFDALHGIQKFLFMNICNTMNTLTRSLNIIISIERCADMAVKRAKIPFAVSIWKTNMIYYKFFHKTNQQKQNAKEPFVYLQYENQNIEESE
jgi:hypothetical protein